VEFYIERNLPITLVEQIKGQIVYAISHGKLRPATAMPSVRELASELDVAPMTITRVYRELVEEQLLETKPGVGTFVADITSIHQGRASRDGSRNLEQIADAFVQRALAFGHTPSQVRDTVLERLDVHSSSRTAACAALVGNFKLATEAYAREAERILQDLNVRILPVLRSELQADLPGVIARLQGIEVVIAVPTRLQEIRTLLEPYGFCVMAVAFQVSPETRRRVAAIQPRARVGVVATYPEFLSSLLEGVIAYGLPEAHPLYAFVDQETQVREMLAQVDVVVYASGSEKILEWLPDGMEAFEYRHVPDPASLNRLRPLLEERQGATAEQAGGAGGRSIQS
jgi:DNA-binding transcriptional regulator YhcF (GntR family)